MSGQKPPRGTTELARTDPTEANQPDPPEVKQCDRPEAKRLNTPEVKPYDPPKVAGLDSPEIKRLDPPEVKRPEPPESKRLDLSEIKRPVRRKLFGTFSEATGAALQENFQNMLQESRQHAREKWNFDFENEQPLEGQWDWEKLADGSDLPRKRKTIPPLTKSNENSSTNPSTDIHSQQSDIQHFNDNFNSEGASFMSLWSGGSSLDNALAGKNGVVDDSVPPGTTRKFASVS